MNLKIIRFERPDSQFHRKLMRASPCGRVRNRPVSPPAPRSRKAQSAAVRPPRAANRRAAGSVAGCRDDENAGRAAQRPSVALAAGCGPAARTAWAKPACGRRRRGAWRVRSPPGRAGRQRKAHDAESTHARRASSRRRPGRANRVRSSPPRVTTAVRPAPPQHGARKPLYVRGRARSRCAARKVWWAATRACFRGSRASGDILVPSATGHSASAKLGGYAMWGKSLLWAALGMALSATMQWAQPPKPATNWRGAGPTPCVGSDGGVSQCPPAPRVAAVRAGRVPSR